MKNLKEIPDTNFRNRLNELFPKAFENELLDVNNNEIIKCKKLNVIGLNIQDLTGIEWFINLEYLYCSHNRLTSLPKTLKILSCSNNQLTNLPNLPSTLKELWCSNNNLTTLPKLPKTLEYLACSNNQLTFLPNLPDTLEELSCYNNRLTSLPILPSTLELLWSYNNNMLPPAKLPKNLKYFEWSISYRNKNNQEEGERFRYVLIK